MIRQLERGKKYEILHKTIKDESEKGTDVLAFKFTSPTAFSTNDQLCIFEVKAGYITGTVENACNCTSGKKSDGTCCDVEMGWNGTSCVWCWDGSNARVGTGGSVESACICSHGKTETGACLQ